jgi:hypothetical protein
MEPEAPPEPPVTTIEHEPPDTSGLSYVDNLLAREEAGEWTRGEGLVATLRLFVGELDAGEVLRHPEVLDNSGAGIIGLAQEFLENGSDAAAQTEIERLLGLLIFTPEQIDAMTGAAPPSAVLALHRRQPTTDGERRFGDLCQDMGELTPCLFQLFAPELNQLDTQFGPGKYTMSIWSNYEEVGWTDAQVAWIVEAFSRSATTYEALGLMPSVDLLVTPLGGPETVVYGTVSLCSINVNSGLQSQPEGHFKQTIAADMASCMLSATFAPQLKGGYQAARWWNDGLRVYLSNVVYPAPACGGERCDFEWVDLPGLLAAAERGNTVLDRASTNWALFQHLSWSEDNAGIMFLISTLPSSGGTSAQRAALAAYPGMDELYHRFAQGLTDAAVPDTGGGLVPYKPKADEITISDRMLIIDQPEPFGVVRLHLTVDAGRLACMETVAPTPIQWSWRFGSPGASGEWTSSDLQELEGEAVFLFTTTERASEFTIQVKKVVDAGDECDPPPDPDSGDQCELNVICGPSGFYQLVGQLPPWLQRVLR